MANQILIRIDKNIKDRFERTARHEGKSMTMKIRELIETYVNDHDIGACIDDLWSKINADLQSKNVTPDAIDRAIRETRSS